MPVGLTFKNDKEEEERILSSRQSGALGSRLTGAGWGGCAVSLVRAEHLEQFVRDVREKFYLNSHDAKRLKNADRSVFATFPASGIYAVRL